jgi:hypothetical protein
MNVSERLVAEYGLPRGSLLRIFPVDMEIDRLGEDDHAYSFDWEEGKQDWFMPKDSEAVRHWPVLAEKVKIWMEEAKIIAVRGYKHVQDNGRERCDSESDSEHSDHGKEFSVESMYTPEMIGRDGKPKNAGPQRLSDAQVLCLRASALCAPGSARPTAQAEMPLADSSQPTRQASVEQSSPLAPLDLSADTEVAPKAPKKRKTAAKVGKGRAGGQETDGGRGPMETRANA